MAIEKDQFTYEENRLQSAKEWLKNEIILINRDNQELESKIAVLKKQAKGRYNEELETSQKLYNITIKNLEKYNEAISKPYFARIDFREYKREKESYYIGKFGLADISTGDEIVIDWRAPISDLYYSGTEGETYYQAPIGVINGTLSLKRKFIIEDSLLKDAFDEGINEIILKTSDAENENALIDEYLRINLEQSVSGKLKDVVATIQKEQNLIIRAEKNMPLIVQGSAGSGKTTIALHRLAYLLYKHKNILSGKDILVIAPNKLFLDYISDLLPNLGVEEVKQKTFEEFSCEILGIKGKIISKDKKLSEILECKDNLKIECRTKISNLKGSILYKDIMDIYIKYLENRDSEVMDIMVEEYVLFDKKEIRRLFFEDLIKFPINKRKDEIKRYLKLKIKEKISNILSKIDFTYEYLATKIKKSMEDGPERRSKLIEIYDERDNKKKDIQKKAIIQFDNYFVNWKHGVNSSELYLYLFNNEEIFNEVVGDKISKELYVNLKKDINDNFTDGNIDSDDLAAMLYLKFMIDGLPEKYKFKHLVVDEAQDYSIFQLFAMKMMASNNSLTIVGDIGQGIYFYKGIINWQNAIDEAFEGEGEFISLTQSYRSTVEIIDFANKILKQQSCSLEPAKPVLRHGKKPEIISFENGKDFSEKVDTIVDNIMNSGKSSIAVIGKTLEECKKIKEILKKYSKNQWKFIKDTDKNLKLEKIIIPSYMTKGLEFDCSVIYDCSEYNYEDTELDKKILYVVLTRALHEEYIFYNGNITKLLK